MEIDFLKALKDVLEDIVRTGKVYQRSKIDKITPQYGKAIFSLLKEKETVTVTTGGLVVKPNGNLELLLERSLFPMPKHQAQNLNSINIPWMIGCLLCQYQMTTGHLS